MGAQSRSSLSVLGVGDNTVDVYVDKGVMFPGGNAVNVAVMAGRLGARAAYLGCLARDHFGDLVYGALAEEGLDLGHCRRVDGENACALVGHNGEDRVFLGARPGVRGQIDLVDADYAYAGGFDVVHTSVNSDLDAALPRLAAATKLLSYDFSYRIGDDYLPRAPYVDIAFLSFGERSEAECLAVMTKWRAAGVPVVVGTRGALGSLALVGDTVGRQPIASAKVVDTLGAGDGFIAGFLCEYAASADVTAALAAGAVNAARACGEWGGFGHGEHFDVLPDNLPPRRTPAAMAPSGAASAPLSHDGQPSMKGTRS